MPTISFPNSPFQLNQPFPPAGDQPAAIDKLVDGINDGLAYQTLLGVTGSGKTYTMANVIARIGRPALVMAPNKTLAAQLYSEMKEFFPDNAVEYFVSYYDYYQPEAYVPSRDLFIEKDSSINEHIEQMRLSATKSLLERKDAIIVATVSCIYGVGDPTDYYDMRMIVRPGDKVVQQDMIRQLIAMQYSRSELDFRRGTFRVRGDNLDVFPAENADVALRISMFDDEVESLTLFDPLTGHTVQKTPRYTVYAKSQYVSTRATTLGAIEGIKTELRERIDYYTKEGKLLEAQRIQQRTTFDLEMLNEIGFCKGIENYSRHLSGRPAGAPPPTLIDYLPKDALMIIDESHVTIPQVGGMYKGDRARKENLVGYGKPLTWPQARGNRADHLLPFPGAALCDPPECPDGNPTRISIFQIDKRQQVRSFGRGRGFTQKRQRVADRGISLIAQQIAGPRPQHTHQQGHHRLPRRHQGVNGFRIEVALVPHFFQQAEVQQSLCDCR